MDANAALKRDLSMLLSEELTKQLMPGETVLVSLPGSFGEALAVTEKRAFVIRDCDSGPGCKLHAYPMSSVTGAEATASGTGGFLELKLSEPVANPEEARVYFPSYNLDEFQKAAAFVAQAAVAASTPPVAYVGAAASVVGSVTDADRAAACAKCGTAAADAWAFCIQCGTQLRMLCEHCGAATPKDSKYCRQCGTEMMEAPAGCVKCGARVSGWHSYCSQCGSLRQVSCVACGARVVADYKYCANCGRMLGSDKLDPVGARSAQRRIQEMRDANQEVAISHDVEFHPPVIAENLTAEQHNQRGRELFEEENVEAAIREFRLAVAMQPGNASYHCNLAVALDENEQDAEALAEYEATLGLDPKDLTALLSLGYMYNESDDAQKAREIWSRVLDIAPDSAEAQEVRDNFRHMGQL